MPLSFGVSVLRDPAYQRLIDLLVLAERRGFEYGWTYDRGEILTEPGHGRFAPRSLGAPTPVAS